MVIVNEVLIPALDKIGEDFEKGTLFLPQLIMAASVAQAAFEVIREHMVQSNAAPVSKGKIVIATVKGDIHDIGKNIVKVLLENYGYDVIDLGKDVEYQAVVDAVRENDVKLVGLSALMTTTLYQGLHFRRYREHFLRLYTATYRSLFRRRKTHSGRTRMHIVLQDHFRDNCLKNCGLCKTSHSSPLLQYDCRKKKRVVLQEPE